MKAPKSPERASKRVARKKWMWRPGEPACAETQASALAHQPIFPMCVDAVVTDVWRIADEKRLPFDGGADARRDNRPRGSQVEAPLSRRTSGCGARPHRYSNRQVIVTCDWKVISPPSMGTEESIAAASAAMRCIITGGGGAKAYSSSRVIGPSRSSAARA